MISAFAVAAALAVALTTVGAYLRHRRRITAQRRAIVERVAVQLRESLQRFPKVSVAVRHEKRRGSYILV
ncbi:MAG: hypothetical protein HY978_04570, partial [Candidatus Liptonbacteria bacterium]|nr:hypothetical protein [Candidatus Liptonbacteria bacterium]